jgi:hypothetical protein
MIELERGNSSAKDSLGQRMVELGDPYPYFLENDDLDHEVILVQCDYHVNVIIMPR